MSSNYDLSQRFTESHQTYTLMQDTKTGGSGSLKTMSQADRNTCMTALKSLEKKLSDGLDTGDYQSMDSELRTLKQQLKGRTAHLNRLGKAIDRVKTSSSNKIESKSLLAEMQKVQDMARDAGRGMVLAGAEYQDFVIGKPPEQLEIYQQDPPQIMQ